VNGAEKMPVPNPLKVALQQHIKVINDFSVTVRNLEDSLKNVNSVRDAQLANVDLQNMLQNQQQTLQMLSNIEKELYDTAMAVIRKIGN
jgi:flagellar biosynthesis/type III secretory pathway protein FliH